MRRMQIMKKDPHILECTNNECGYVGRPWIKMSGLLCRKCRVVLKDRGTPEYAAMFKELRDKIEKA